MILLLPLICFRAVKTTLVIFVLLDGLFVANLMYFRTYFTAIPLDSYLLASNLSDFSSSVIDSCRVVDLFFPLSTIAAGILWWRNFRKPEDKQVRKERKRYSIARYVLLILLVALIPAIRLWSQNGFKAAYERLQDAYLHTCNVPMYTIFGSLYYDYTCDQIVYTEDIKNDIDSWLAGRRIANPSCPTCMRKIIVLLSWRNRWKAGC